MKNKHLILISINELQKRLGGWNLNIIKQDTVDDLTTSYIFDNSPIQTVKLEKSPAFFIVFLYPNVRIQCRHKEITAIFVIV